MGSKAKDEPADSRTRDVLMEDHFSIQRRIQISRGKVTLIAVPEGYGWKATIRTPALFSGKEFHALFPKGALDTAEAFVRRSYAEDTRLWDSAL